MKHLCCVLALLGALSPAAHAANFSVSPSGSNANPGTQARPWRTVQKACDTATPGSTVLVARGTYNEKVTLHVQGSAQAGYITFQGAPGAVISGAGRKGAHLLYLQNKSYVRFIGFELKDDAGVRDGSGVRIEGSGSHIELRGLKIHGVTGRDAMGITVYGTSGSAPLSDLVIQGNEIYACQPAPSEALTLNGNVAGFQIEGNLVHDVNNIGIDMIGGEGTCPVPALDAARAGVCRLNRVERARSNYGGGYGAGLYVDGGRDIVVERNAVSQSDLGIEIGCENQGRVARNIVVRDNILSNNDKAGLAFGGYDTNTGRVQGCQFLHNTLFQNQRLNDGNGEVWVQFASGNAVRNNLISARAGVPVLSVVADGAANTFDYNLWFSPGGAALFEWGDGEYEGLTAFRTATGQDAHGQEADPQLPGSGPTGFHPKATSPAINAGDPRFVAAPGETDFFGQPRVQGRRVDVGASEEPSLSSKTVPPLKRSGAAS